MGFWSFLRDMFIIGTFAGMRRNGRANSNNDYNHATPPGNSEPPCCSGPWDDCHYAAADYYDSYANNYDDYDDDF